MSFSFSNVLKGLGADLNITMPLSLPWSWTPGPTRIAMAMEGEFRPPPDSHDPETMRSHLRDGINYIMTASTISVAGYMNLFTTVHNYCHRKMLGSESFSRHFPESLRMAY